MAYTGTSSATDFGSPTAVYCTWVEDEPQAEKEVEIECRRPRGRHPKLLPMIAKQLATIRDWPSLWFANLKCALSFV